MWGRIGGIVLGYWRIVCAGVVPSLAVSSGNFTLGLASFCLVEILQGSASMLNALRASRVDGRRVGWVIPVLYGAGFVVAPVGGGASGSDLFLVACCVPRLVSCCYLRVGTTCGVSTFYRLCDRGPYAFIRHPMQMSGLLCRLAFCVANPCLLNFLGLAMMTSATVLIVRVEEQFLRGVDVWREYAGRVRWRLLPGVW